MTITSYRKVCGAIAYFVISLLMAGAPFASAEQVKDTRFDHDRGIYDKPISVEISTATNGASVFYTLDGSIPTPAKGIRYVSPLSISKTTVLRAAAFRDGLNSTNVDTVTYIFPEDVAKQTGDGLPKTWGQRNGQPVTADYGMDAEVGESDRIRLLGGLRSLPSVSLTLDIDDWLGPERGLYCHTMQRGVDWERAVSMEMIFPAEAERDFQVRCGLRVQGGWNRRPEESPKHSLRLMFKKEYGPGKLKQPIFTSTVGSEIEEGNGVIKPKANHFNTLILRGGNNNTWLHRDAAERSRGDYVRDQWVRDTFAAMGHLTARGRYVHLYINGLYWGVYNLAERPDGAFQAAHGGGVSEDYDARNGDKPVSGDAVAWKELMEIVNAGITTEATYAVVATRLDLTNFADYMLLNLYGANADYDAVSNWYAGRSRKAGGKFQMFVWDGERTNEDPTKDTIEYDCDQSPARIFQRLRQSAPFRRLFAERVRLHCVGDGVLTPASAAARYESRVKELEDALVAESARWGDYRRDVHPHETEPFELYTVEKHWRPEVNRLLHTYFPARTKLLTEQLRSAGLYSEQ